MSYGYSQFTNILVDFSYFFRSSMALFQTVHLYSDRSSFLLGLRVRMAVVGRSLFSPTTSSDSTGPPSLPSLNHFIWGGGDPPMDEHVRLRGRPSVAVGVSGRMEGGEGSRRTVRSMDLEWSSRPVPPSFIRHSNCPLSLS